MADDPVPPFGATRAGVTALVPEAQVVAELAPGRRGVTEAQLDAWLAELSGRVARALDGWETLPDEPDPAETEAGETLSDREELILAARGVVHNGAASYLEAARHPEQAGKATTTYAAVLWQRFEDGLAELVDWLAIRLERGDPADTGDGLVGAPGLAYAFPDPTFTAGLRF